MNGSEWFSSAVYIAVLTGLAYPLGIYIARVYELKPVGLDRILGPLERLIYRISGTRTDEEMNWKKYTLSLLMFSSAGFICVFAIQRLQGYLPLNPEHLPNVPVWLALNTAVSFVTNTNWQAYDGELTMSYFTQMLGFTVQNFVSAASGIAVLAALVRGITRKETTVLGNFWVDLVRGVIYILLPLSFLLAIILIAEGTVQTLTPYTKTVFLEPYRTAEEEIITGQVLAMGPVASQVAIKQLGTNGGGFFGANSAHPFENPTPFSNFLETLAILLIPAALCHTFGAMVKDKRQGWALFAAILFIFIPLFIGTVLAEREQPPELAGYDITGNTEDSNMVGNMEGKEVRFGVTESALWAVATTSASNGSVNAMHDSFNPLGGLIAMWSIQLGEVVFGGVGSGLYGLLVFALIAVFIAGLMVGRTPEYLGKKIDAFEMKMAALVVLIPCVFVLLGTAIAVVLPEGNTAVLNPGPHGFSEILYAFSSAANNNGSAFGGLDANNTFYNISLGIAMLFGRFGVAVPVLAIAGSLARKKSIPTGLGTLPTHTPLFVVLLVAIVILVGALTFIPALSLGPIVEHLLLIK